MGKEIRLPFKKEMRELVLVDKKIYTTRPRRYGQSGDFFYLEGERFHIIAVEPFYLYVVAFRFYKEEGFDTPEDFIKYWAKIYPKKGYVAKQKVFAHFFVKARLIPEVIKIKISMVKMLEACHPLSKCLEGYKENDRQGGKDGEKEHK